MSISHVSRPSVLAAIAEYDKFGREEFLEKYNFGYSRAYFLVFNGRRYDSKAIIGVAHGYEFPDQGVLRHADFSGGDATVKAQLNRLGFEVQAQDDTLVSVLSLFATYNRTEVHKIFAPNTRFTPQSGTWGLQGIVAVPDRSGDFVLFVTFGKSQGLHTFDEGITEQGVLSWQSQIREGLQDERIAQLINHDELTNSIHLFLRTRDGERYTYLGRLKYVSHDPEREYPVYFQWQLLDFPIPDDVLQNMRLTLQPLDVESQTTPQLTTNTLEVIDPPSPTNRRIESTFAFRTRKVADYTIRDARNREIGLLGEELALEFERQELVTAGRGDLAQQVRHVSVLEGDGAGYDILSYTPEGVYKYIEVKTTGGVSDSSFFVSASEVEFSRRHADYFYLYRICGYDQVTNTGKLIIISGSLTEHFHLTATEYRASF